MNKISMMLKALLDRDIAINEFAKKLSVNVSTVQRWVYRNYKPSDENVKLISEILGISEEKLLNEYKKKR